MGWKKNITFLLAGYLGSLAVQHIQRHYSKSIKNLYEHIASMDYDNDGTTTLTEVHAWCERNFPDYGYSYLFPNERKLQICPIPDDGLNQLERKINISSDDI